MDMPFCLALQGYFHGWGRELVPLFCFFQDFSMPWQAQAIRPGLWRARTPWGWRWTSVLSAPREARALGGRQGEQGKNAPTGTEVPLGANFFF